MKTVSFTEADAGLEAVFDKVVASRTPMLIQPEDGEAVVVVPQAGWEEMEQALELAIARASASD